MGMEAKEITGALMYALSTPTSKIGKRLLSEPDLAELFAVGRHTVRQSVDTLVRNGVLARRKGSGTFVKHIPSREDLKEVCKFFEDGSLLPKDLFAECAGAVFEGKKMSHPTNKTITIGYWSDLQVSPRTSQIFLPHLVKCIAETGNSLHLHSVVQEANSPYSIDKLIELLRNSPSDAYVLESRWADLLVEALGKTQCPRLITCGSFSDARNLPLVMVDTHAAICQAVKIFKEQGFTRIGMIGFGDITGHSWQSEVQIYKTAMFSEDLTYSAYQNSDASISSSMAAVRHLLSRNDPPEAIYVADDYVMMGVAEALAMDGIVPGRDLAIITLDNKGCNLLENHKFQWSRMQICGEHRASLVVDILVNAVRNKKTLDGIYAIYPSWIQGATHFKKG